MIRTAHLAKPRADALDVRAGEVVHLDDIAGGDHDLIEEREKRLAVDRPIEQARRVRPAKPAATSVLVCQ